MNRAIETQIVINDARAPGKLTRTRDSAGLERYWYGFREISIKDWNRRAGQCNLLGLDGRLIKSKDDYERAMKPTVQVRGPIPEGSVAMAVAGDFLYPTARSGDYVVISPATRAKDGDLVVTKDSEGKSLLRRWHPKGKRVDLVADNPKEPVISYQRKAVRVVGIVNRIVRVVPADLKFKVR